MKKDVEKIAKRFGLRNQQSKTIEECSELIQAISKIQIEGFSVDNYYNLVEEIADVEIMIEQLKFLHEINEQRIIDFKKEKIERTIRRYEITESTSDKICGNCKCFSHDESDDSGICGGLGSYRGDRMHWDSTCSQHRKH